MIGFRQSFRKLTSLVSKPQLQQFKATKFVHIQEFLTNEELTILSRDAETMINTNIYDSSRWMTTKVSGNEDQIAHFQNFLHAFPETKALIFGKLAVACGELFDFPASLFNEMLIIEQQEKALQPYRPLHNFHANNFVTISLPILQKTDQFKPGDAVFVHGYSDEHKQVKIQSPKYNIIYNPLNQGFWRELFLQVLKDPSKIQDMKKLGEVAFKQEVEKAEDLMKKPQREKQAPQTPEDQKKKQQKDKQVSDKAEEQKKKGQKDKQVDTKQKKK